MQFGEEFHHRQPEPGPLESSRQAAVDLAERLEQALHLRRRNADAGIDDTDFETVREVVVGRREPAGVPAAGRLADDGTRDAAGAQRDLAAVRRELHGIGQQVVDDLLDLARVRLNRAQIRGGLDAQADAAGRGLLPDDRQAVHEQRRHLHRLEVELHLAGFHLGQIEDVVDQREQVLAAAEDVPDQRALLVGHLAHQAVGEHFGEAHDGVEGRPQLVRHVGEELGLHPARRFQLGVLLLERLLDALEFGDVARGGEDALKAPVAVVEGRRVVGHHRERAVPGPRGELVVGDLAFAQHAVDPGFGPGGIGEVVLERGADQLVARAPGQRFHLFVDVGDDAAGIRRHQRVDGGFDQRPGVELLVAQPLVQLRRSSSTCLRAVLSVPISR